MTSPSDPTHVTLIGSRPPASDTGRAAGRPHHHGTASLFASPLLDRLTRTHIGVPVGMFFAYSAGLMGYCLWRTDLPSREALALFMVGLGGFTLVEYLLHRFVYHLGQGRVWKAGSGQQPRWQYRIHGIHHDYPKDRTRLAMPPWLSLAVATLMLWGLHLIMGDVALAFWSGFLSGYASYLLMHYAVHVFPPPAGPARVLWVNHAVHHYRAQHLAFGVSSPIWDYIFGTYPTDERLKEGRREGSKER